MDKGKEGWNKAVGMREERVIEEEFEKEANAFFYEMWMKSDLERTDEGVDFSKPGNSGGMVFKF